MYIYIYRDRYACVCDVVGDFDLYMLVHHVRPGRPTQDELSSPAVRQELLAVTHGRDHQHAQLNALGIATVLLGASVKKL